MSGITTPISPRSWASELDDGVNWTKTSGIWLLRLGVFFSIANFIFNDEHINLGLGFKDTKSGISEMGMAFVVGTGLRSDYNRYSDYHASSQKFNMTCTAVSRAGLLASITFTSLKLFAVTSTKVFATVGTVIGAIKAVLGFVSSALSLHKSYRKSHAKTLIDDRKKRINLLEPRIARLNSQIQKIDTTSARLKRDVYGYEKLIQSPALAPQKRIIEKRIRKIEKRLVKLNARKRALLGYKNKFDETVKRMSFQIDTLEKAHSATKGRQFNNNSFKAEYAKFLIHKQTQRRAKRWYDMAANTCKLIASGCYVAAAVTFTAAPPLAAVLASVGLLFSSAQKAIQAMTPGTGMGMAMFYGRYKTAKRIKFEDKYAQTLEEMLANGAMDKRQMRILERRKSELDDYQKTFSKASAFWNPLGYLTLYTHYKSAKKRFTEHQKRMAKQVESYIVKSHFNLKLNEEMPVKLTSSERKLILSEIIDAHKIKPNKECEGESRSAEPLSTCTPWLAQNNVLATKKIPHSRSSSITSIEIGDQGLAIQQ